MVYGKKQIGLAFLLAALAGCLLHGLYALWPNAFTALVSPIWESLWEHLKILVWPYLAAALVLTWNRPTGIRPWLLSLLLMCAGMLGAGYLYHIVLGGESFWPDLVLYLLLLLFGFWFPRRFSGPFEGVRWKLPLAGVLVLLLLMVLFTLSPPDHLLFVDLSGADTWSQLPC